MNPHATLVQHERLAPSDIRLRSLAEFLGVPSTTLDPTGLEAELSRTPDHDLCLLASAGAISHWCHESGNYLASLDRLRQKSRFLYVYGFSPQDNTRSLAAGLTKGRIADVREFAGPDSQYEVASTYPELTKEFTGLSFGPIRNHADFGFACSSISGNFHPLISIAGLPFWVVEEDGGCTTFLLACNDIVDIQEKTEDHVGLLKYFSRLLPPAMFLKWVFKNRCWYSEHRFANFIIDDPLLKDSYGYLNYEDLLLKMDENNFATTIAFIPWNHRRTRAKAARLFRDRPDKLSLCIHGCDHTQSEFGITDLAVLNQKALLASSRMTAHRESTGLKHVPVMVFPQAHFSPEALMVLKCNNYLAAVNSRATPGNSAKCELRMSDFLEPAITRFGGVPLYLRRYPGGLERFAFDLFFGKPLLVVEHHAYLRDGGGRLIDFVVHLNSFRHLEWRGLGKIVENTYLRREVSAKAIACKLYSNSQVIENRSDNDQLFVVAKSHADDVPVENTFINGHIADFRIVNHTIQFEITIPAHASAKIEILYKNLLPYAKPQHRFQTAARTLMRRMLSEFRDDVLWKSAFLMSAAQTVNHKFLGERLKSLSRTSTTGEELI
jgi:hypothetical protein